MWDFFKYFVLPFILAGIALAVIQGVLWKVSVSIKSPKLRDILDKQPNLVLKIAGVCLIIFVLYHWISNGIEVQNTGF